MKKELDLEDLRHSEEAEWDRQSGVEQIPQAENNADRRYGGVQVKQEAEEEHKPMSATNAVAVLDVGDDPGSQALWQVFTPLPQRSQWQ